jgi:hypothetical protein
MQGTRPAQEIEGIAIRRQDRLSRGGITIRRRPSAVWVVRIFVRAAGSLDHAVERDIFDDPALSHAASALNQQGRGSIQLRSGISGRGHANLAARFIS